MAAMQRHLLLIQGARQMVQVTRNKERVLRGDDQRKLAILQQKDGEPGFSIVVDSSGKFLAVGKDDEIGKQFESAAFDKKIDARGKCIIPGLVDGHTHAVWAGDRVHEFAMKLAGATYLEVHAAGGGIHYTVDHVRKSSKEDLLRDLKVILRKMSQAGTTLAEVKSGYGLDTQTEIKMLSVIEEAKKDPNVKVDISSTYCGAHAVPKNMTTEEATNLVLKEQIPKLKDLMDKGDLHVDNIDVFCEEGCFDVEQTKRILQAGTSIGLAINFHGEELNYLGSAEMAAGLNARAISHLEEVSDKGIKDMAAAGTVGVLLPTTAYILRLKPPPAREMIKQGMAIALGSDFNPNAHCLAMPVVLHLACVLLHLSMEEALAAATINAAASLGKSDTHGSIEVGKTADLIIIDTHRWEHLIYQFGDYHHTISHVVKNGEIVHSRDN